MRRAERQMLTIIITLVIILILGFLVGYKLLPTSRLSLLFGGSNHLLRAALPFQTSLAQAAEPTEDAPLDELLIQNAGLLAAAGVNWPQAEADQDLHLAEQDLAWLNQNEPSLLIIEEDMDNPQNEAGTEPEATLPAASGSEPLIAVYCTHSSEEYSDGSRISGQRGGVHTVAQKLSENLNQLGLPTIYCDTIHDAPDWNLSYVNSLASVQALKSQYPSLQVFIDVHRDADSDTVLSTANGNLARLMLVVGSNQRLEHPNWQQNLNFSTEIENALENLQNGISRGVRVHPGRYNQHITNKCILVEVGSTKNSTEEALASTAILARALQSVLAPQ